MKKNLLTLAILGLFSTSIFAETIFNRDNGAEPKSIDPQLASEDAGSSIIYDTFEGLTTRDASGNIIPGVASSWEVSEDGLTYIFHLREDAKWSNDTPVTAQDFVFAWRRAVNPATGSEYSFVLYPLKNAEKIASGEEENVELLGVEAIDAQTLEVTLANPTPYFLDLMTHYTTYPTPRAVIEQYGDKWTQPANIVSNGAYHLTEWKPQAKITIEKSDTYWNHDEVNIDKVVFYPIESRSSALSRYRAGELDYVQSVATESLDWARKNVPQELHITPSLATYWYGFNLDKAPFKNNIDLRKALNLAVDRNIITEKVTKAGQIPAYGVVPPLTSNTSPYRPDYADLSREEQITLAKELYAKAGYGKDNPLKVEVLYNTSEAHKKIAIAVAAMWKQTLGVETELVNKEWKVMLSDLTQKNTQIFRYAWIGDYNDPNTFLEIFQANASMNHSGFNNPEYDGKMKEAAKTLDLEKRAVIMHDAEQILIDDYAVLPLYHYVTTKLIKPHVKGFEDNVVNQVRSQYLSIE